MPKKAAVLTLWGSLTNYGQQLQAFALIRYLEKKGYTVTLIRYLGERKNFLIKIGTFFNKHILKKSINLIKSDCGDFKAFQRQFLNYSAEEYYSYHELKKIRSEYDLYVTGSDQVWGPHLIAPGFLGFPVIDAYCLAFRDKGKKGISYAASFGFSRPKREHARRFIKKINQLDAVSVREIEGVQYLEANGISKAVLVPDPTLLFDGVFYNNLLSSQIEDFCKYEKECFLYFVPNNSCIDIKIVIDSLRQSFSFDKMAICTSDDNISHPSIIKPNVFEWLACIREARIVVTNSYHCIIFCLQFSKDFYYIPLSPKYGERDARISSLLKYVGIPDREILSINDLLNIKRKQLEKIDWNNVKTRLDKFRTRGENFLDYNT